MTTPTDRFDIHGHQNAVLELLHDALNRGDITDGSTIAIDTAASEDETGSLSALRTELRTGWQNKLYSQTVTYRMRNTEDGPWTTVTVTFS